MSHILERIQELVAHGEVYISDHGYDELAQDGIFVQDILRGVSNAVAIEDYPEYYKGPCVLTLQKDEGNASIHVVWGISKNASGPAVLVTAYRPDPDRWTDDFVKRKR